MKLRQILFRAHIAVTNVLANKEEVFAASWQKRNRHFCGRGVWSNCSLWETLPCNWEVRGHCKELPVILVNKAVDPKRIIGKNGGPRRRRGTRGRWPQKNWCFCTVVIFSWVRHFSDDLGNKAFLVQMARHRGNRAVVQNWLIGIVYQSLAKLMHRPPKLLCLIKYVLGPGVLGP
jgi:hypothetical protein